MASKKAKRPARKAAKPAAKAKPRKSAAKPKPRKAAKPAAKAKPRKKAVAKKAASRKPARAAKAVKAKKKTAAAVRAKPKKAAKPKRSTAAVLKSASVAGDLFKPRAAKKVRKVPVPIPPQSATYMSAEQRKWFRNRLLDFRSQYLTDSAKTAEGLRLQEKDLADEIDRANSEFGYVVELRENERLGFLQYKIDAALRQLEEGKYGFCSECGDEIGIMRMAERPVADLCIDCKLFSERQEQRDGD